MNETKAYQRIRSLLSIEGLAFTIILSFVAVCSVLRSVNMLVVVSGMMLAAILLSWRISRHIVRNVITKREIPLRLHVGQPVDIQWQITNHTGHSVFQLRIVDVIQQITSRLGEVVDKRRSRPTISKGRILSRKINNGEISYASYRVLFSERGIYQLGPTTVESRFPLALVTSWFRIDRKINVHVAPQLGNLADKWDRIFLNSNSGSTSRSNYEGNQEDEFFAIREWRSGDNKRKIHWRSSAKKHQPMVKQFERITEQHRGIVLDLFAAPNDTQDFLKKTSNCELTLSFVASVLSNWSQNPVGNLVISICGRETQQCSSAKHVEFAKQCMQSLSVARFSESNTLNSSIRETLDELSTGTPCLVVSSRTQEEAMDELDINLSHRIHWLCVESDEFAQLFTLASKSEVFVSDLNAGVEA